MVIGFPSVVAPVHKIRLFDFDAEPSPITFAKESPQWQLVSNRRAIDAVQAQLTADCTKNRPDIAARPSKSLRQP
jgi:hypothetical protein